MGCGGFFDITSDALQIMRMDEMFQSTGRKVGTEKILKD